MTEAERQVLKAVAEAKSRGASADEACRRAGSPQVIESLVRKGLLIERRSDKDGDGNVIQSGALDITPAAIGQANTGT